MSRKERGHRVFAFAFSRLAPAAERNGTADHRRKLLARAAGDVLEVGAGIGLNLPHYPEAVREVVVTEPDPHMRKRLQKAVVFASAPVRVVDAAAEALPFPNSSFDTVVATLVLCSVGDPAASVTEIGRVLRPGGHLLFYEHVRAQDPRLARRQDRWERPWGLFGGGCHPNRDTVASIEDGGFALKEIERLDVPGTWLARTHALGVARRPAS